MGGNFDAFASKYDAAGNHQWTKQVGTTELDVSNGVSADGLGNVYVSGYTEGDLDGPNVGLADAFVSKYDAAGNRQWTKQLGSTQLDHSNGVSADGLGSVYISGLTNGNLGGPNAGFTDAFVTKYDEDGNLQWTRQLGTTSQDYSLGVSADVLGDVYISGSTEDSLGGTYAGDHDAFVAKYSGPPPGDYNSDKVVDAADYVTWRDQLGQIVPACSGADANCNTFVEVASKGMGWFQVQSRCLRCGLRSNGRQQRVASLFLRSDAHLTPPDASQYTRR